MKKRRRFDREFKQMVVEPANKREDIYALTAELDFRSELIYSWRGEAIPNDSACFPGQGEPATKNRTIY